MASLEDHSGFSKLFRKRKGGSVFFISFSAISILSLLIISSLTYFSYKKTKEIEKSNFLESTSRSHKLMLRLAQSYNSYMSSVYRRLESFPIDEILLDLKDLESLNREEKEKLLFRLYKKYQVRINLIDIKTRKILIHTKQTKIEKYEEVLFPETKYIYKNLEYGKHHLRVSWIEGARTLKLILRTLTKDGDVLRLLFKVPRDRVFDNLIDFFRNAHDYEPLIEKMGIYSSPRLARHGVRALAIPENLSDVLGKNLCAESEVCDLWTKIDNVNEEYADSYIRYMGIRFSNSLLQEKLDDTKTLFYYSLILALIFSLFLSFLISSLFSHAIQGLLRTIRDFDLSRDVPIRFPRQWVFELWDLTEAFRVLLEKFQKKRAEARRLARDRLQVADNERRKISRDLHDTVGQLLIAANMKIHSGELKEAESVIHMASEELRSIYDELEPRSLDFLTLKGSIEWYLQKFFPLNFPSEIEVEEAESFDKSLKTELYRIVQESIANVKKHAAEATSIQIYLQGEEGKYSLSILNDRVRKERNPKSTSSGRGLENIALRAESFGGYLSVHETETTFEVRVSFKVQS